MEHDLKLLAAASGLVAIALSGWNLYLQGKAREISSLWKWKDSFEALYRDNRLSDIREFATKAELHDAFNRVDRHLDDIRRSVDRIRDRLDPEGSR